MGEENRTNGPEFLGGTTVETFALGEEGLGSRVGLLRLRDGGVHRRDEPVLPPLLLGLHDLSFSFFLFSLIFLFPIS